MPAPSAKAISSARKAHTGEIRTWKQRLVAYGAELRESGRRLPRNPRNPNTIDTQHIAATCSVPEGWLLKGEWGANTILKELIAELGIENVRKPNQDEQDRSYGALLLYGKNQRELELSIGDESDTTIVPSNKQQLYNTIYHFNEFRRVNRKEDDDIFGDELANDLPDATQRVVDEKGWNDGMKKKHRTEMRRWAAYARQMATADDLPPDGIDALRHLLASKKIDLPTLQTALGLTDDERVNINRWLKRARSPSVFQMELISRIEEFFQLPPGTLSSRINFWTKRGMRITHLLPSNLSQYQQVKIRPYLPENFAALDEAERTEIATDLWKRVTDTDIPYRREMRDAHRDAYRLLWADGFRAQGGDSEVSRAQFRQLSEEWARYESFKTAELPPLDPETGLAMERGDTWRPPSAAINRGNMLRMFGAATLPRERGGLGLAPENATMALLAMPQFYRWCKEWADARRGKPSNVDIMTLTFCVELLNPKTGWLAQQKGFVDRLEFLADFLGTDGQLFIAPNALPLARENWTNWCDRVAVGLSYELYRAREKRHPMRRDPFDPIQPILDDPRPLSLISDLGDRYRRRLPDERMQPTKWAQSLQTSLIWDVNLETFLRARNIGEIHLKKGALNSIQKVGDRYQIRIHGDEFKNYRGAFFRKHDETIYVTWDLHPDLTPWLDLFIEIARPILLEGEICDFLFVKIKYGDFPAGQLSPQACSRHIRKVSKLIAFNRVTGEGMPGVESFGSNALRDIGVTHAARQNAPREEAAVLLTDNPRTVARHYNAVTSSEDIAAAKRFTADARPSVEAPPQWSRRKAS